MKKQPTHADLLRELEALKKQVEALTTQPPTTIIRVIEHWPSYPPYQWPGYWPHWDPITTPYWGGGTIGNGTQSVDSNNGMPQYTLT
jgi:hypothetical protein